MQPPEVSSGLFDTLPSPIGPGWRLRVLVAGTNFVERAVPIVARVGDVPVEGISLRRLRMEQSCGSDTPTVNWSKPVLPIRHRRSRRSS
jgi:hypothetical protein